MNVVVGTAGHIDHGKSTLVAALTGKAMDRLPEEKRRGITVDLGFAPLALGAGINASVVDVPGHEKLVHTMVAGACGMDVVLLVVAADEGVMPQAREHLAICRHLGLHRVVVALTKVDRVEPPLADLAREDVVAHLEAAGFVGVPVVPVSAPTGAGVETLRAALRDAALTVPARDTSGSAFLPVDRAFTVAGFGTVVTGTLAAGTLALEDAVDVFPGPPGLRVRGLQAHGKPVPRVAAGQRVAVNLPGVAVEDVHRGCVLVASGMVVPSARWEVQLETLAAAPPLKDGASITVHVGTDAVPARLRTCFAPGTDPAVVQPGQRTLVQVRLQRPVLALPGQRFIIRGHRALPGQGSTLGGGEIMDPLAPVRRRGSEETRAAALAMASGDTTERLCVVVRDQGITGATLAELRRHLPGADLPRRVEDAVGRGRLKRIKAHGSSFLVHPAVLATWLERVSAVLAAEHEAHPALADVPFELLRSRLPVRGAPMDRARLLGLLGAAVPPWLVLAEDGAHLATHRARVNDPSLLGRVEGAHVSAGRAPPSIAEMAASLSLSAETVTQALRTLVEQQRLVRVKEDLHFASAVHAALVEETLAFIDAHGGITTQEFKELMGQSRKYVIPFLEHLDDKRITLRVGERRVRRAPRA